MSQSVARYDYTSGELRVRIAETLVRRAAARLQVQGASGVAVLGSRIRALVLRLGGTGRRGPLPNLVKTKGGRAVRKRLENQQVIGFPKVPKRKI